MLRPCPCSWLPTCVCRIVFTGFSCGCFVPSAFPPLERQRLCSIWRRPSRDPRAHLVLNVPPGKSNAGRNRARGSGSFQMLPHPNTLAAWEVLESRKGELTATPCVTWVLQCICIPTCTPQGSSLGPGFQPRLVELGPRWMQRNVLSAVCTDLSSGDYGIRPRCEGSCPRYLPVLGLSVLVAGPVDLINTYEGSLGS